LTCSPLISPLFPYTTLFRSSAAVLGVRRQHECNSSLLRIVRQSEKVFQDCASRRPQETNRRCEERSLIRGRARHFVAYRRIDRGDRKSTRLNSSHGSISYAV